MNNYIILNKTQELVGIILYYYLKIFRNGYASKLDSIKTRLAINQFDINNIDKNQSYQQYYFNYYLPRINNRNNKYKILPEITSQELEKAVQIVNGINLANIQKHIIVNINVAEILFYTKDTNDPSDWK